MMQTLGLPRCTSLPSRPAKQKALVAQCMVRADISGL
jgi:hypothetical protein